MNGDIKKFLFFFFYNLLLLSCQSRMAFPLKTWKRCGGRDEGQHFYAPVCVSSSITFLFHVILLLGSFLSFSFAQLLLVPHSSCFLHLGWSEAAYSVVLLEWVLPFNSDPTRFFCLYGEVFDLSSEMLEKVVEVKFCFKS